MDVLFGKANYFFAAALVTGLFFGAGSVSTAAENQIQAVYATTAPVIDGDVSDSCWQSAAKVTDFYHTDSGTPSPEKTTAWIAYDKRNIYAAFDCKDSQPGSIRAQQMKRGGDMGADDSVMLHIDPFSEYRDAALAYFQVNAAGTQTHHVQSPESGKTEWIGDWQAAVKRNPDGYSVEMKIPFSILRYNSKDPRICVGFSRYSSRLDQEWWAPDLGKSWQLSKLFAWEGLNPPAIRTKPIILLHSFSGFGTSDESDSIGLDIKGMVTPGITGLLTVNPDFRNIEQDVDSINYTYTENTLDDNRPFFQEGGQYFPGPLLFYTRRIQDIDAGMKVVGAYGEYKLAALSTTVFGEGSHTVAQVGRQFGPKNEFSLWLGGINSHLPEGDSNSALLSTSYTIHASETRQYTGYLDYLYTTPLGETESGLYRKFSIDSSGGPKRIGYGLGRLLVDDNFKPYLGVNIDRGIQEWNPYVYYWDSPKGGKISFWNTGVGGHYSDFYNGDTCSNRINPYINFEFRNGTSMGASYYNEDRPPYHDKTWEAYYCWKENDLYRKGFIDCTFGKVAGGNYQYISAGQGLQLTNKLSIRVDGGYRHIDPPSEYAGTLHQIITSMNYDLSNERSIGGRLIQDEENTNYYLSFRQHVRSGMDIYLIYGDPNAETTSHTLLVKLIRPL